MSRRTNGLFAVLVASLFFIACDRPDFYRSFIPSSDAEQGVYRFEVPMEEQGYDLLLFADIRGERRHTEEGLSFPLSVFWRSPSGDFFKDDVWFVAAWDKSPVIEYRNGVIPYERGLWTVSLVLTENVPELEGLGLVCRIANDGTR